VALTVDPDRHHSGAPQRSEANPESSNHRCGLLDSGFSTLGLWLPSRPGMTETNVRIRPPASGRGQPPSSVVCPQSSGKHEFFGVPAPHPLPGNGRSAISAEPGPPLTRLKPPERAGGVDQHRLRMWRIARSFASSRRLAITVTRTKCPVRRRPAGRVRQRPEARGASGPEQSVHPLIQPPAGTAQEISWL
jgi:hypothetical protein